MEDPVILVNFYNPGLFNPITNYFISPSDLEKIGNLDIPEGTSFASIRRNILHTISGKEQCKVQLDDDISSSIRFFCKPLDELSFPFSCTCVLNINLQY